MQQGEVKQETGGFFGSKETEQRAWEKGLYIYCIAECKCPGSVQLGNIGIETSQVFTIPHEDLCAVVHSCDAKPYISEDENKIKEWIRAHQNVIEKACEKFGTAIPFTFNTIVKGESPRENLLGWIKEEYGSLKRNVERVRGKQEFGIQIFIQTSIVKENLAKGERISEMMAEMKGKSPGAAYFHKERIERALREEMELFAEKYFRDFYRRIYAHTHDIKVEKLKKVDGWSMLMNISCLLDRNEVIGLGEELDRINSMDGFSVRFIGPWPPYSFVSL